MHGYSSSSESDDDYRRRQQVPATTTPNDANKKKKRPKPPPQQSINRIWKRFSNKKFSTALSVLPFDPVLPSAVSERSNEPLAEGYERAAEECRRKVRKIIQECRRVNMRYRDPGWDLDWDLKMEKGHCLNSLGRTKFDLSKSTLMNPNALVPKAVKRVHEIFENPKFMEKVSGSDVKQGGLGDCWLIASLSGLANVEDGIKRICVEYDTKIGIYGFVFFRDGEWIYSIVDDKLYLKSPCWDSPSLQRDLLQQIDREDVERVYRKTYQTGSKALFFAQCKDQNETWVPLIEKAYAKAHGDYASLSGGWIGEGLEDLSGGVTTELLASDILDLDGFWDNELSRVNEEFLFGCSTGLLDGGYGERDGISEGHAYVVMEARTLKNGTRLVKLRNPWGKTKKGIWEGAWSDGSKEWTTEVQEELGHTFGNDSVFWISYEDLLRKYQHFDRTRLFREPDWRCSQRWIGVDVPWKPQFNEKFRIKLTRESPMVLVLSQLDNRYFKGLHGQYSFRLHFRLHERDRPGAEDYIVRSHGNYLMDRSVSVELPCMLPGEYSVFISVVGERNTDLPSVEDVVKRECKKRVENEKLAQVGYAYDLAHSKATAHLEAVAAQRKKAAQQKASNTRKKERHRLWEKRHLTREVNKRQARKNNKKLEAKNAALEEKRKKEEALKPKDVGVQTEEAKTEAKGDSKAAPAENEKKQEATTTTKESPDKKDEDAAQKSSTGEEEKPEKKEDAAPPKEDTATKEDDETPEATPIHTPAETPAMEKSEEEAGSKTETEKSKEEPPVDASEPAKTPESEEKTKEASPASDAPPSAGGSDTSGSPKDTPRSEDSVPAAGEKTAEKVPVPPVEAGKVSGGPPPAPAPAPASASTPAAAAAAKTTNANQAATSPKKFDMYVTSDGESSASPIDDWEELYSSDNMTRKPRIVPQPPNAVTQRKYADETEDENEPDPWNAVCVVGFRVYSKDPELDVRVVMEGGTLEEGGMGEKGEADLDNAQANAAGQRGRQGSIMEIAKEDGGYEGDSEVEKKKKSKD
ncbi:hypothetical protein VTK73DRAFT_9927 [Phialemonium thermophilum]|uniref:Calpain catalytic domain-containing protein n=1 Tax=Phialemonium thermophilum TaxID=223376 RepID=A0ABR3VZI5_9PEZI